MTFPTRVWRMVSSTVFCTVAVTAIARAQPQPMSVVHGTVTDQTAGVIAGASVTLVDNKGSRQTEVTNDHGVYVFQQVPAGRYTLIARCRGFLEFTTRVDVRPDAGTTVDVRLMVAISVTAEVKGKEQPGLSTDPRKNLSALLLTSKDIANLPNDPQRLLQRVLEMAGSTGRPNDVTLVVDGFREYQRFPPKSTIDMIRINSNPFSAEFSQPSLDRVEVMTKPGSDSFHGEAMVQAGSSIFDARNPLSATKPAAETLNASGFFQGPIDPGKIDFLAYAGHWRQGDTAAVHATVLDSTFNVVPLATAVSTPIATTSAMLGTNFQISNQRINVSYTRNGETRHHLGLDSGLDLLEHAYDRSTTDEVGRLWWTSVGQRTVNDVRFELTRTSAEASPRLMAPAVQVLDAFYGGGNQDVAARGTTTTLQGSETLTLQRGRHTVKAGASIEDMTYESTDRAGFGGTFVFGADVERDASGNPLPNGPGQSTIPISPIENYRRTVQGRPGYAPSQFWIVRGTTAVGVGQWDVGSFVLDDWSLLNRLSLSYGVRQDLQTNVAQRLYLSPRASVSWLLDEKGRNAIKAGSGIFTGHIDPAITLDTRKLNGTDRQFLIINRPSDFPAIPPPDVLTTVPSAVHTTAPDLRLPYSFITSVSYERELPAGLFAVCQYTYSRGVHLLRLRNIVDPGVANPSTAGPVFEFESSGHSQQRELMAGLRGNITPTFTLFANYIYGVKDSDTDGPFTVPANSRDLSGEWGPAADDQRHQFVSGATVRIGEDLEISPYLAFASGRPFNVTTGRDNNGDTMFSDRPAFARIGDPGAIATRLGWLNPNPQPGDPIIPRNFGREPSQLTLNLSVTEMVLDGFSVTIDAENLINHARFVRSDGVLTSPTFGMPIQALSGRQLMLIIRAGF